MLREGLVEKIESFGWCGKTSLRPPNGGRRRGEGGDDRDRTDDLLNAIQALYQLSYIPEKFALANFSF